MEDEGKEEPRTGAQYSFILQMWGSRVKRPVLSYLSRGDTGNKGKKITYQDDGRAQPDDIKGMRWRLQGV